VLEDSDVSTRLPAQDLARARACYAEKLGLEPVEERPGGLRSQCGSGRFPQVEGNPSAGIGERAARFRDSEGNLLAIGQAIRERQDR
jgi:hypothetical protein